MLAVLAPALFFRGMGLGAIGIPSLTAAYASVKKQDLPMATTSLNIVQRLGGPTLTTVCATFLAWRLRSVQTPGMPSGAFTSAFVLLCALHVLLLVAALRLPVSVDKVSEQQVEEESLILIEVAE